MNDTRYLLVGELCGVLLVAGPLCSPAADPPHAPSFNESEVKATYLFHFPEFIEWPAQAFATTKTPFIIGVTGDDALAGIVERLVKDETIHGRSFAVTRCKRPADWKACHLLFIGKAEKGRYAEIFAVVQGVSVVTVGDAGDFTARGGMIMFCVKNNKVQFAINPDAAEREGVKISAKLLQLARPCGGGRAAVKD